MPIGVVIIGKDQGSDILNTHNSIKSSIKRIFVLDRCSDDSEKICIENNIPYLINLIGKDRQPSRCRNIGLNYFKDNEDILFLDTDRITNFDIDILNDSPFDVTLTFCENDIRLKDIKNQKEYSDNLTYFNENKSWGTFNNACFSSAIFIRRKVINKVIDKFGYFWDEDFTLWGEEDRHLGDLLYSVDATCGFTPHNFTTVGKTTDAIDKNDDFIKMCQLRYSKIRKLKLNTKFLT